FFQSKTVVACDGERVVGFASHRGAYVTWMYVDPAWRRRGVGAALMRTVLVRTGKDAWLNTLAGNAAAVAFYRKWGFVAVKEMPGSCDGYPCWTLRMALPSSPMRNAEMTREAFERGHTGPTDAG